MNQTTKPNRRIFSSGDLITFILELEHPEPGEALLRTTIGGAAISRQEIIDNVECGKPFAGRAWHDVAMKRISPKSFEVSLPLLEVGLFESKCCFIPTDSGKIRWTDGANHQLKVECADNFGVNTIYTAFVRQFKDETPAASDAELKKLDEMGYTVIPRSGTFRNLIKKLDFIMGELGSRIIQLLPIHPTPCCYGRMGRYGSPFAAVDYFAVDPALAEFDVQATVMEQFGELVNEVHRRAGRVFLDIPVNHTGWASKLQNDHPEYFVRKPDGTFVSPGAWGVVWEDLCKLDYTNHNVHKLMAEVFLFWCGKGVDGFRCDAGYMLPVEAWRYIVAKVRNEYPDTVFMLEGLGGPGAVQERLLGYAGLDWAYSELFQNYSRNEISNYYSYMQHCSHEFGELVNFAETHDNLRLAAGGKVYSAMRCALNALLSVKGSFGFANGVEFCATEKIDVHSDSSLNQNSHDNLVSWLRKIQTILAIHPAFWSGASIKLAQRDGGNVVVASRRTEDGEEVLVAINLDDKLSSKAYFTATDFNAQRPLLEMISNQVENLEVQASGVTEIVLEPGAVKCFTPTLSYMDRIGAADLKSEPEILVHQRAQAQALLVWSFFNGQALSPEINPEQLIKKMLESPTEFGRYAAQTPYPAIVRWRDQVDTRRLVMVGEKSLLLVESDMPFLMRLHNGKAGNCFNAKSLPKADGGFFSFVRIPRHHGAESRCLALELTRFAPGGRVERDKSALLQLPVQEDRSVRMDFGVADCDKSLCALHTNELGGLSQVRAWFGYLNSKYDAVLAANPNPKFPTDRRVMFTRLRAWVVLNDFSQELDVKVLDRFRAGLENRSEWDFLVPVGQGSYIRLGAVLETASNGNAVRWRFIRQRAEGEGDLSDDIPVRLILRPDVEDRNNHEVTKAYAGPEIHFPTAVRASGKGFDFAPAERKLHLAIEQGVFHWEPEWKYMEHLTQEQYYGLECKTDLFSPGYFESELLPGRPEMLFAEVTLPGFSAPEYRWPNNGKVQAVIPVGTALIKALRHYVVKRDDYSTVIAGYPWFLDWGRDTLIALRGLIKAGFAEAGREIILQFASFEKRGTIPNMIRGNDDSNRDTSDAPLWLFVAVRDYIDEVKSDQIMSEKCGARTLKEILESIAEHYMIGTPNGIHMDGESGLIFSPSHFTWMDTNHPAGTPREGYPIEIQALWFAALSFLGRYNSVFLDTAKQVQKSVEQLFYLEELGRFSDCLHCSSAVGAAQAVPDDHVRPNQLFAVTLGLLVRDEHRSAVIKSCEELIIPGAIRSLADRPVNYHLPVIRDGRLLNDPAAPYWGRYNGPEDTERKAAYHNGTAWGWPFPSFCEALYLCGGEGCRPRATRMLLSICESFNQGSPGQLPEVIEGDYPHLQGGCPAQAWSVSESYRVYELLTQGTPKAKPSRDKGGRS